MMMVESGCCLRSGAVPRLGEEWRRRLCRPSSGAGWSVERMMQELREPQPGSSLVAQHLAHMMLVQALRLHMANGLRGGAGWLFALADQHIGAAITSMHGDPARR